MDSPEGLKSIFNQNPQELITYVTYLHEKIEKLA